MPRQSSSRHRSEGGYILPLLLCLGALLALRLAALMAARIDLVLDEAQYWTWSRELAFGYFSKPPMIAWIIRGATELCGSGEACVRAASPVLYTLTSLVLFATGRALYRERIGFWSAIVFATLPGVSYSSMLITTDVPLVLFWSVALYAWVMLVKRREMRFAVLLGLAAGLGLLSKQAMIYLLLCIGCHAVFSREAREAIKGGRGLVALLIAAGLTVPMLLWNAEHDFVTFHHTATNMGWKFPFIHPLSMLDYVVVQFGVFGPILLAVLLRTAWRAWRHPSAQASDQDKLLLLLCFSLPVLALLLIQSLLSRAHGNWSAVAYPAASILVTAVMLDLGRLLLFRISLGLHLAVAVLVAVVPAFAPQLPLFERLQFLSRVVGWRELAEAVRTKLASDRYGSLVVDTREMAAELLYYLRDVQTPLYVLPAGSAPASQYEMTRPFVQGSPEPALYVSLRECARSLSDKFAEVTEIGTVSVPIVRSSTRTLHFCRLAGFHGGAED